MVRVVRVSGVKEVIKALRASQALQVLGVCSPALPSPTYVSVDSDISPESDTRYAPNKLRLQRLYRRASVPSPAQGFEEDGRWLEQ